MKIITLFPEVLRSPLRLVLVCCFVSGVSISNAQAAPSSGPVTPPGIPISSTEQSASPHSAPAPPPSTAAEESAVSPVTSEEGDTTEVILGNLFKEDFTYNPKNMLDPFVSFIKPAMPSALPSEAELEEFETDLPAEQLMPQTPLQKMSIAEIERGLRAITWGELGRRAVIEDASGKGFIVGVGTPAGDKNGYVAEIYNDRLVIQQQFWDRKAKRMVPQNTVVKLNKENKEKP